MSTENRDMTNNEKKENYDNNPLSNLSEKTKKVLFAFIIIIYRLILFIILVIYVYTGDDDEKKSTNTTRLLTDKFTHSGYYIPYDDKLQNNYLKCSLIGCEECQGNFLSNECIKCGSGIEPIFENGKIIKCNNPCEVGEGEKCLSCYEDKNECKTCNIGYNLTSSGKCDKIKLK